MFSELYYPNLLSCLIEVKYQQSVLCFSPSSISEEVKKNNGWLSCMVDFNKQSKPQQWQQFEGICSSGDFYYSTLWSWPCKSWQVAVCRGLQFRNLDWNPFNAAGYHWSTCIWEYSNGPLMGWKHKMVPSWLKQSNGGIKNVIKINQKTALYFQNKAPSKIPGNVS